MYAGKRFPALSLIFILCLSLLPLRSAQAGRRELLKSSVPSGVNLQPGIGALVWNTFLGGAIEDDGKGIAVDGSPIAMPAMMFVAGPVSEAFAMSLTGWKRVAV